jgi:hypothetical protein
MNRTAAGPVALPSLVLVLTIQLCGGGGLLGLLHRLEARERAGWEQQHAHPKRSKS